MELNYRSITKITGQSLGFAGLSMLAPIVVSIIYRELDCTFAFGIVAFILVIIGLIGRFLIKPSTSSLKRRDGYLLMAIIWVLFSAAAAFPYFIQGCIPNYISAFFEACSGFTTTGASVFDDASILPKSMLFWRSFTSWLGALLFLVFTLTLVTNLGIGGSDLTKGSKAGANSFKTTANKKDIRIVICGIYFTMTILEIILLAISKMSFFDALLHTFGTVSTGGMDIYGNSVGHYDSPYIEGVIGAFMFLAGISYLLYFLAITNKTLKVIFKNQEFRLYIILTAIASLLIMLNLTFAGNGRNILTSLRDAAFQVISILSTTGFVSKDFTAWPTFSMLALLLLFFIGPCSASPGSGVKCVRIIAIFRIIRSASSAKLHPNAMMPVRIESSAISNNAINGVGAFVFLYAVLLFTSGAIVTLSGTDLMSGLTAAASCLGNIGPTFGEFGPLGAYGTLEWPIKLVLSFTMIAGRLGLYSIMILFSRRFLNPYKS